MRGWPEKWGLMLAVIWLILPLTACDGGEAGNTAVVETAVFATTEAVTNQVEGTAEALIADAQATTVVLASPVEETIETEEAPVPPEILVDEASESFDYVMRSSHLIGLNIGDQTGEVIGEVEEVLFDRTGQIRYVIFDTGDVLNVGGRVVAVEWSVIDPLTIGDSAEAEKDQVMFVLTAGVDYLETLPEVDEAVLNFTRPVIEMPDLETNFGVLLRATWFNANTPFAVNLRNPQNDDLGEVEELVFDMDDGEVLYGIAEVGGFLGVAEAPVVIDWSEMTYDEATDSLVVDADEETLTDAPILNLDEWGDNVYLNPDWDLDIRQFWQGA